MVGTRRSGDEPELVIDLGTIRDDPAEVEPRRPFTWRRLRPAALAVVAALLLTTGGSGLPPPPTLTEIATLAYASASASPLNAYPNRGLLLTEELLFTTTLEQGGLIWLVSAYELTRGRRIWTYDHPVNPDTPLELAHRAGLLLLSAPRLDRTGMRTVALDERTGQERWSLPHQVHPLYGADNALAIDTVFPADTAIPDNVPYGEGSAYGSPWGQTYSQPSMGMVAAGITLSTGEVRWRSELLTSVEANIATRTSDPAAAPDRDTGVAVVTRDGGVELWDPLTAAVRHRFPAVHPGSRVQLGGDLLLVHHSAQEVTAYSAESHQRRWSRPVTEDGAVGFCTIGGLVCDSAGSRSWMVDASTGERIWPIVQAHIMVEAGGHLIEFVAEDSLRPLRTVDPRTGEPQLTLMNWQRATTIMPGRPILLVSPETFHGPTWLGVLAPGAAAPVTLGAVPVGVTNCQLTTSVIVCDTPSNDLRIWRYRMAVQPDHD